ncbi:response regulator transcription factor [Streptomyces sp. NPDC086554]|uniref:response regulator transcription factor n=1 Tax=Streptomyces sp. NPDC086554 TaxID=3154864 RepID=UPI00341E34A9
MDPHISSPRLTAGGPGRPASGVAAHGSAAHRPSAAWRLLVVENDAGDAEKLVQGLTRHGHTVERAATGQAALRGYRHADLVLLDLELPDLDGLEVCREVRSASDIPLIAVTARGSEVDRVLGLQAGADDYLVKPYGFHELMARIDAVMRRMRIQPEAQQVVLQGPLRIDSFAREVRVHGRQVDVTPKEFDLLHLLASHPGTVIPRHRIMRQVWGDSWSRRTIDTHVSSLRKKLGAADWITTIRGVGLQFSCR